LFPVSFGVSTKFYYRNSYHIVYVTYYRKCCYSKQINLRWWSVPKLCMYLISRFYWNRKNLMLTKHTCFTVLWCTPHVNACMDTRHQDASGAVLTVVEA